MNAIPGWYYAQGDPAGTERWWNGTEWVGEPQQGDPQALSGGFPAAPPALTGPAGDVYGDRSPLGWYKLVFSRYAEFSGRSRRKEYWWFTLINTIIAVVLAIPMFALGEADGSLSPAALPFLALLIVFGLATIVPSLAVAIRRLHDVGRSGWWYLIGVIPIVSYIGSLVLLVWFFSDGKQTTNEWGKSPKYGDPFKRTNFPAPMPYSTTSDNQ